MKCDKCGAEARRAGARFCARCGAPLPEPATEPAAATAAALQASATGDRPTHAPSMPVTQRPQAQETASADEAAASLSEAEGAAYRNESAATANGHVEHTADIADSPTRADLISVGATAKSASQTSQPSDTNAQSGPTTDDEETMQLPALSWYEAHHTQEPVEQSPTMVLPAPAKPMSDARRGDAPSRSPGGTSQSTAANATSMKSPGRTMVASRPLAAPKTGNRGRARSARTTVARSLLLVGIVVVIAAIVVGAVLVYQNVTAGGKNLAATAPYTDPAGYFALRYPALWTAKPISNGVKFVDSTGTAEFDVQSLPATGRSTADSYIAAEADKLNLSAPDHEQVGSVVWAKRSGLVTTSQGVSDEVVLLAHLQQGRVYLVTEVTPISNFAQENQLAFLPALQSFQFK
jgi:hypothetical protein